MGGVGLDYSIYGFMGGSLFENMVTSFNEKDEQMKLLKFLLKNAGEHVGSGLKVDGFPPCVFSFRASFSE